MHHRTGNIVNLLCELPTKIYLHMNFYHNLKEYPLKSAIKTVIWVLLGQNVKIEQRSEASYQSLIYSCWNLVVNLCFQIGGKSKSKLYLFLYVSKILQLFWRAIQWDPTKIQILAWLLATLRFASLLDLYNLSQHVLDP